MPATIKITISKEGQVVSETNGIKGDRCLEVDKFIHNMGTEVKIEKSGEFYEDSNDNDVMINNVNS